MQLLVPGIVRVPSGSITTPKVSLVVQALDGSSVGQVPESSQITYATLHVGMAVPLEEGGPCLVATGRTGFGSTFGRTSIVLRIVPACFHLRGSHLGSADSAGLAQPCRVRGLVRARGPLPGSGLFGRVDLREDVDGLPPSFATGASLAADAAQEGVELT